MGGSGGVLYTLRCSRFVFFCCRGLFEAYMFLHVFPCRRFFILNAGVASTRGDITPRRGQAIKRLARPTRPRTRSQKSVVLRIEFVALPACARQFLGLAPQIS